MPTTILSGLLLTLRRTGGFFRPSLNTTLTLAIFILYISSGAVRHGDPQRSIQTAGARLFAVRGRRQVSGIAFEPTSIAPIGYICRRGKRIVGSRNRSAFPC